MKKGNGIFGVALALSGIVLLAALYAWAAGGQRGPRRIYFLTIDTLRADHVGAYGYPRNTTPFIDELARNAVVFERALSATSHTAPSHSSFFTGLFPFQHGVRRNWETLPEHITSLPGLLASRGYVTAAFPAVEFLDGNVGFPKSPAPLSRGRKRSEWYASASKVFGSTLSWLSQRDKSEKLLVWMHVYDVHQWKGRGNMPNTYTSDMLEPKGEAMSTFLEEEHAIPPEFFGGREKMLEAIDGYDLRLRFVDDQLKHLFDEITRLGLNEDALWIISSDHGEGLGNHGYEGHGEMLYDEQLLIPLVVHSTSGAFPSARVSGTVRSVDVFPTIVSLIGEDPVSVLGDIEGRSFASELLSGDWGHFSHLPSFAERRPKDDTSLRRGWRPGEVFAIHSGKEKLIEYSDGPDELYDLSKDPKELEALQDPAIENALRGELLEILKRKREGTVREHEPELNESQIEELRTLGYL